MDTASHATQPDGVATKVRAVLLLGAIANDHNFARMGVGRLRQEFDLTILDLNKLLGRQEASKNVEPAFEVTEIASIKELEQTLLNLKPRFALDFVGIDARAYLAICKALETAGTDLVVVKDGPIPSAGILKTLGRLVKQALKPEPSSGVAQPPSTLNDSAITGQSSVLNKLATVTWAKFQNKIDIIGVFAGSKSYDINSSFVSRKIWSSSEDVHTFQARQGLPAPEASQGKIVFLDSPIADGSDWVALGRKPLVSAETYYPQLRKLFSEIEKVTGNQVVIAGHPNHKNQDGFAQEMGGRAVAFNATPELIRDSAAVITHGSTAVSFAVLARKPLVFINSKDLSASAYGTMMAKMAKLLKRPIIYLDSTLKNLKPSLEQPVDLGAYATYEDGYLQRKAATENQQWDSFIDLAREKYRA